MIWKSRKAANPHPGGAEIRGNSAWFAGKKGWKQLIGNLNNGGLIFCWSTLQKKKKSLQLYSDTRNIQTK